jgi:hypothetical protein
MHAGGVVFLRGLPLLAGVVVLAVVFGGGTGVAGRVRCLP